jgi:Cu(I)/Ag(I) efflux system membrane fusion protein
VKAAKDVDMALFEGKPHERWMDISTDLINAADTGKQSESIAGARDAFFSLSLAAIELHDTFGHASEEPFYLTFCPMARDNAGAYWLQQENIVWNSFYGESMLRCGEIKQQLPAAGTDSE